MYLINDTMELIRNGPMSVSPSTNTWSILITLLLINPTIGCILNSLLIKCMKKLKNHFPDTIYFLIQTFNQITLGHCFAIFICFGLQLLYQYTKGIKPIHRVLCTMVGLPFNFLGLTKIMIFALLALERWNATRNDEQAAKDPDLKKVKLVFLLLLISPACTSISMVIFEAIDVNSERYVCGNTLVTLPVQLAYLVVFMNPGVEFSITALYIFVYIRNKKNLEDFSINTTKHSVIGRYNLKKTLESAKLVLPTLLLHALLCAGVSLYLLITIQYREELTPVMDIKLGLCIPLVESCNIIVHPIIMFLGSNILRLQLKSLFFKTNQSIVEEIRPMGLVQFHVNPEDSDQILKNIWNNKLHQKSNEPVIKGFSGSPVQNYLLQMNSWNYKKNSVLPPIEQSGIEVY